jgi:hypothetical protein
MDGVDDSTCCVIEVRRDRIERGKTNLNTLCLIAFHDLLVRSLGSEHSRLHGSMRPLYLGYIYKSCATPDQCATGKVEARDGLEAAFIECTSCIGDAFASFEEGCKVWMVFEFLRR